MPALYTSLCSNIYLFLFPLWFIIFLLLLFQFLFLVWWFNLHEAFTKYDFNNLIDWRMCKSQNGNGWWQFYYWYFCLNSIPLILFSPTINEHKHSTFQSLCYENGFDKCDANWFPFGFSAICLCFFFFSFSLSFSIVINSEHLNQYLFVMSGSPVVESTNHK